MDQAQSLPRLSLLAATALLFSLALAPAAEAGERHRAQAKTFKAGGSVSRSIDRNWGGGQRSLDMAKSRTFRDGTSRGTSLTRGRDRALGSAFRERTISFRDGTSASRTRTLETADDGAKTLTARTTNRAGETRSHSKTFTITPGQPE